MKKKTGRKQKKKKVAIRKKRARVRARSSSGNGKRSPLRKRRVKKPVRKRRQEKPLRLLYEKEHPAWKVPYAVALEDSSETFLLNYEEGKKLKVNIRLVFQAGTITKDFTVMSGDQLEDILFDFDSENESNVDAEIEYLESIGVKVSMIEYKCSSYYSGKIGTAPKLIEILYG